MLIYAFLLFSYAVDLLKKLKDKFYNDEVAREVIFDEVFDFFVFLFDRDLFVFDMEVGHIKSGLVNLMILLWCFFLSH